jgi:ATP-dependent exoDNAse (exonuclease V) alpha subunit
VANRELGTIQDIDTGGNIRVRLHSGRQVAFTLETYPHLDYGYAVTSHSSQGQTADRVLVHVEAHGQGERLVNRRLAYVALSRGRYDAHIYTDNKAHLADVLSRDVSHRSAIELGRPTNPRGEARGIEHTPARQHSAEVGIAR